MQMKTNSSSPEQDREAVLFAMAIEKPIEERSAFLEVVCGSDDALCRRLEALLVAHEEPASVLVEGESSNEETRGDPVDIDEVVGQTIGRYKLLEKVGEGGCGVVYVAEQTKPVRRRVALKVIKLGMDTKQVVARFEAESQALALMDHPNIAKVLDAGATECDDAVPSDDNTQSSLPTGRPYFVMELVRGIKITDYCDQNNLSTKERLDLFTKVCLAIQHAHQKGIIHRDIKPSNILVTLHDGVPVPKVIDFGIAKATEGRLTDATVYTQLHQFIGTPAYMSPEQAEMSGLDIDTRSDIYSLGVLLYELLTGRTPFEGRELMSMGLDAMRRTIREEEPARPSTRVATLGGEELTTTAKRRSVDTSKLSTLLRGDLDWIAMKCLEKDRMRRYETANGIVMDVRRHLDNEPVVARPPSAAYRIQKAWKRNRLAYTAAALVIVALATGLVLAAMGLKRAVAAQNRESEQREKAEANERRAVAARANEAQLRKRADQLAQEARRNLYTADMNLAAQALVDNNWGKAKRILEEYRRDDSQNEFLGWEWRYMWNKTQKTHELKKLAGHTNYTSGVTFLGDENRIASCSYDGTIRLWDWRTGKSSFLQIPTPNEFHCVQASSDGKVLAGISYNTITTFQLTLWDVSTLKAIKRLDAAPVRNQHRQWDFIPDQNKILYLTRPPGGNLREAHIYDWGTDETRILATGIPEDTLGAGRGPVRVSPRGDFALLSHSDGFQIVSLTAQQDEDSIILVSDELDFSRDITAAAISPDGNQIAVGLWDAPYLKLYDLQKKTTTELIGHGAWVTTLAFSGEGATVYSGSGDQTIRIWDVSKGKLRAIYRGHDDEVWGLDLSPDGSLLVSGSKDHSVRLWPADPPVEDDPVRGFLEDHRLQMIVHGDEQARVIALDRESRRVHFLELGRHGSLEKRSIEIGDKPILFAGMLPHGTKLFVADSLGISRWNLDPLEKIDTAFVFESPNEAAFNLEETRLGRWPPIVPTSFGALGMDELEAGTATKPLPEETLLSLGLGYPTAIAFESQTGQKVVGFHRGWLLLVTAGGTEPLGEPWKAHGGRVSGTCFSPDGSRLYTTGLDGFARVWDVATQEQIGEDMRSQLKAMFAVAVSPNGKRLATASIEGGITIWDLSQQRELGTFYTPGKRGIGLVEFLSDDILIAYDGRWNVLRASSPDTIDWNGIDEARHIESAPSQVRLN